MSRLKKLTKFWKNKKVFITGHTGFKGSWLVIFLNLLGAKVSGYSLKPSKISFFNLANISNLMSVSTFGDIRDYAKLKKKIINFKPDFIIHMAAQPLVRYSYDFPKYTYEVNALGTVNLLNIINEVEFVKSVLIVTTDKVYKNVNRKYFFEEKDELGGDDPYSSSKACCELICNSYCRSFFVKKNISCVTVRAGNVIGGGDFALDRIIPDYFRSLKNNHELVLRYPNSIRPWQHVLDPLYGYILLLMKIFKKKYSIHGAWNFGPNKSNNAKVKYVIKLLNQNFKNKVKILINTKQKKNIKKESKILMLNSQKSRQILKWKPKYNLIKSIKLISEWYKLCVLQKEKNAQIISQKQIINYLAK